MVEHNKLTAFGIAFAKIFSTMIGIVAFAAVSVVVIWLVAILPAVVGIYIELGLGPQVLIIDMYHGFVSSETAFHASRISYIWIYAIPLWWLVVISTIGALNRVMSHD